MLTLLVIPVLLVHVLTVSRCCEYFKVIYAGKVSAFVIYL